MLFKIENDRLQPLQPLVASDIGWNEKVLENILASHLDRLILSMNLMVIQQERALQPEVDILALSEDGTLFLLELKVWGVGEDAVIQVIRYAQNYGLHSYDKLQKIYRTYTDNSIADLQHDHMESFELDSLLPKSRFNYRQHLIIIGSATDRNTIQRVEYWQSKGMLINILLYRIFRIGESYYFEFIGYPNDYYEIPLSDQWAAIVNTCRTHVPEAAGDMLANNKAAAYGTITYLIDQLKKDVRVFLYHNGVGIIASGKVKGKPVSGAPPFDPTGEEKYVLLEMDCKLDPLKDIDSQRSQALSASEIKEAIGRNLFWAQTLIWVTKDEANKIAYAFKQKQGL